MKVYICVEMCSDVLRYQKRDTGEWLKSLLVFMFVCLKYICVLVCCEKYITVSIKSATQESGKWLKSILVVMFVCSCVCVLGFLCLRENK